MQVSLAWLRELSAPNVAQSHIRDGNVALSQISRDLASRLTMAGLEVESVTPAAPPLPGIIVGEVLSVVRHPNADTSHALPGRHGSRDAAGRLRRAERARRHEGAVRDDRRPTPGWPRDQAGASCVARSRTACSARRGNLGLSDDASGLLELPADLPTGQPLSEALDLDDEVLGFNLTPNRGDCMSVLGIAREVAALGGQALTAPAIAASLPAAPTACRSS